MTASTKTRKPAKRKAATPAQREAAKVARQAKIDQMNSLFSEAEEQGLAESPEFENFSKSFARYSIRNQILVMVQCPHATQVAGFKAWQAEGRVVRKGEKAIMIFGPSSSKVITEEKNGVESERTIKFAPPVVSVFDISQTEEIVEA